MTSQAQIEDEILARRLQSEEFSLQQRQTSQNRPGGVAPSSTSSQQVLSDEELARRLEQEERRILQRSSSQSQVALQTGQSMSVKLHHPMTNRQIGEILLAHHLSVDEMVFELATAPGKYLKAKETGIVEFDLVMDNRAIFKVSNSNRGHLFLLNKAFITTPNRIGAIGWHLSMSALGQLTCNGPRDTDGEWMLVSAPQNPALVRTPPNALPAPAPMNLVMANNGAVMSSGATLYSSATPPNGVMQQPQSQSVGFPGLGAGKDELLKFFGTPQGQAFLSQAEYKAARDLYVAKGALANILHRPDWPIVANRYEDFSSISLDVDHQLVDIVVSDSQFRTFFRQGYTVLPSLVPVELVREALKMVNYWQFKYAGSPMGSANGMKREVNCAMHLVGDVTHDLDLLALYYKSPLPHILQKMLGEGEVEHPKSCQVNTLYPCIELMDNPALLGDKWNIEGFTNTGGHSPFNILVGIALNDMSEADMGNFCIHPESHIKLLDQYHKQAESKQTLFSANPYSVKKPDLGEPMQLKLKAGDVFLCTQRLAHLSTINSSSMPTSIAFFRVSNIDHAVLKDPALYSMWLEYKYASKFMDADLENKSILTATFDAPPQAPVQQQYSPHPYTAAVPAPTPTPAPAPAPVFNSPIASLPPPPPAPVARASIAPIATTASASASPFSHESLMSQPASQFYITGELSSPVSPDHQWKSYNDDDAAGESTPLFARNEEQEDLQPRDTYLETVSFLHQKK